MREKGAGQAGGWQAGRQAGWENDRQHAAARQPSKQAAVEEKLI